MNGISEKKNQIQSWQAHIYLTFLLLLFKGAFALHSLYTWLVSSIGRLLRLKKQIASANTAFITYSCDEIT